MSTEENAMGIPDESEFLNPNFGEDFSESDWEQLEKEFGFERETPHLEENLCTVAKAVLSNSSSKCPLPTRVIGTICIGCSHLAFSTA